MEILKTTNEVRRWRRSNGSRVIALVPTMGSLHEGHLNLIRHAREQADLVIISIFVNPTQFNDPKDFERYPRDTNADLIAAQEAGDRFLQPGIQH